MKPHVPAWLARFQRWHAPLKVVAAMLTLFLIGYVIAVYLLFPPPAAPRDGILVPNLAGLSMSSAAQRLRPLRLGVGDTLSFPHSSFGPGVIIAQSPLPGQQLRAGDRVRLGLSSGPAAVAVPDVVGMGARRAHNLLARLGFEVEESFEASYRPNGTVTRSAPEAGTRLPLPARVLLVISSGSPEPAAPDTLPRDTLNR